MESTIESSETTPVTRRGRKVIKPSKYKNYALLLTGLITSQLITKANNEFIINKTKQVSFFQAQLDYKSEISKLPDGTNNSFEPLLFQAQESSNDTLYYGQAMKAGDSEKFKTAMKKEVQDLNEANVFEIIPVSQKPKDRNLIRFIWSFKYKCS